MSTIKNNLLIRISLFLISIIFSFFIIEFTLRFFWSDELTYNIQDSIVYNRGSGLFKNEIKKYSIVGGDIGYIRNPDHPDYNKYGVFDKSIPIKKEKGTFRILVIGDSVTYDATLLPDGFTKVMQRRLRKHYNSNKIIVMNTGVEGWNSYQEELYFENYGIKLDPDMIVLAFNNSDFGVIWQRTLNKKRLVIRQREKKPVPLLIDFGAFNHFIFNSFFSVRFIFIKIYKLMKYFGIKESLGYYYFEEDDNKKALQKMVEKSKKLKIPMIIAHFPDLDDFSVYKRSPHYFLNLKMCKFSIENNIGYIDLFDYFNKFPAESLRLVKGDDIHPNNIGNKIAGNAISDFIISNNLISIK